MTRIAIAGGKGFVGRAIRRSALESGAEVIEIPRVPCNAAIGGRSAHEAAEACIRDCPAEFEQLTDAMSSADSVVNAAGLAKPDSFDVEALRATNAVLPVVLASAAAAAGVGRLVHISSAAVQGRRRILDETMDHETFSPYSASKAEGEAALLACESSQFPEVVIYRPTSVQGIDRATTKSLSKRLSTPIVIAGSDRSIRFPLAPVSGVGQLACRLATREKANKVVLHPWEGVDLKTLLEAFTPHRRVISVPVRLVTAATNAKDHGPFKSGAGRRIELYLQGQGQLSSEQANTPSTDWLFDLAQDLRNSG